MAMLEEMQEITTVTALVPAAGCGARAGLNGNKILAPLAGKPLLWWTLRALTVAEAMPSDMRLTELIIAARREEFALIEPVLKGLDVPVRLVEGGATRQESVANAARLATGDLILVHDAARPLISPDVIARVCRAAHESGAAIAALPASDTVKAARVQGDGKIIINETLERSGIWLAQTPQVFERTILLKALENAVLESFEGTDCASLVERLSGFNGEPVPVAVVEGETRNFKVTFPSDLERAALLMQ